MQKKPRDMRLLRTACTASVPVMAGYIVLGIGFGIILKTKGYGVLWAAAMSLFIYAGSLQFVLTGLLSGGASLLTVALTSLSVNARHLFYGLSMISNYQQAGKYKPYLIFGLTDETYSLVVRGVPGDLDPYKYYFFVTLFDQCWWVTGSVLGSILGSVLRFNTEGIDFALTALFVTVFVEQWLSNKNHIPALIGLGASIICLVIFGSADFLIPAMIGIAVLLSVGWRNRQEA